jgi:hypothetical protein
VTSIGEGVFLQSYGLSFAVKSGNPAYCSVDGVLFNKDKSELVAYPLSRKGTYSIPNTVITIDAYAFCDGDLTGVIIPEGVITIGNGAFYLCHDLTEIVIPDTVTYIGDLAFSNCGAASLSLGKKVTSIGTQAFMGCYGLTSVIIPESVTSLGVCAFAGCDNLASITINANIKWIMYGTFESCSSLTSVTIPESVTNIATCAFRDCSSLASVTLGSSISYIEDNAFNECNNLTNVYYNGTRVGWGRIRIGGGNESLTNANIQCIGHAVVTNNGECGANGANLIWSLDSDGVLTITGTGNMADYVNTGDIPWTALKDNIISVVVGNGVTSIGYNAFNSCGKLKNVELPASVTSIGNNAFSLCFSLGNVTIPASVTSIGWAPFAYCWSMSAINVAQDNPNFISEKGVLFSRDKSVLHEVPPGYIGSYTIPESVISIHDWAFDGCSNLTEVTIPTSVTSIGDGAFSSCSGLSSVEIPASVTAIGDCMFFYCSGLSSITVPVSVTSVGNYAFFNCTNLTDVYYGGTESQWYKVSIGETNAELTTATIHYSEFPQQPAITAQPTDLTVAAGSTATFKVTATGATSYQWYYRKSASDSWTAVSAASGKTATYSLTAEARHNGYQYRCLVKNASGEVYTNTVTLTVSSKPVITTQPKNYVGAIGSTATATVRTTAGLLTYH